MIKKISKNKVVSLLVQKEFKMRIGQFLLPLLFCVMLVRPAYSTVITGPITNPANGHSYYLLDAQSWTDSEAEAVGLGGHLATVNDQTEQDWICTTFGSYGGVERFLWIGLNDAAVEGTFVWVNGEPVSYTNWASGEPNSAYSTEDYVHMSSPSSSSYGICGWVDRRNSDGVVLYGVVEIPTAAQTWDLAADWSDVANPNGVWSYNGSPDVPITTSISDWNPTSQFFGSAQPAWAAAAWPNEDHVPMWFKRVSDTTSIDIPVGRVGMHGIEADDPDVFVGVVWTSPVSAAVDISGDVWYAMTGYSRSVDWRIRFNDNVLTSGNVSVGDGSSSSSPFDLLNGTGGMSPLQCIAVTPGDKITLEFIGSMSMTAFVGVDLTISTSPASAIPTLSEWGMIIFFILLLGSALWIIRRRTDQESV